MLTVLKGLSRQERKALTKELVGSNNLNISNTAMKEFLKVRRTATMPRRVDNTAINAGIRRQLFDAVGSTRNVIGSSTGGLIVSVQRGC
jgi:hypothetical protein